MPKKAPSMPPLAKNSPVYIGTCTVYTDVNKRQWRAVAASNRRRDVKFNWKSGSETAESWKRCLQWCYANQE